MKQSLFIPPEVARHLPAGDPFAAMMRLSGQAFRDVPGRKTMRVAIGEKNYFIKQHFGVGWREIFKNLVTGKKPVLGAMTEVAAIQKLNQIGLLTTPLVAYGERGLNPAHRQSFVMTEDLGDIVSLETLVSTWALTPPDTTFKTRVIVQLAQLASALHRAGLCHRDFYLCHVVLQQADIQQGRLNLYLIDLHRVLQNEPPTGRNVMKDMAALFFSAKANGLDEAALSLFKAHYLPQSAAFWQQVEQRATRLLDKFNSARFQARLKRDEDRLHKG